MNTSVISINQLSRHFKETVVVDNLSLEVYAGEIFGFLGHNGAGITWFGVECDGAGILARPGILRCQPD